MWLQGVRSPADLAALNYAELDQLCTELRDYLISTVKENGGHLGSNLGMVEITVALHKTFDSPRDVILFDTGHQSYIHKLLTGRVEEFKTLRTEGGMSGYPNRGESEHDWVENSHASTALSYAHGLAASIKLGRGPLAGSIAANGSAHRRHVIAVVGDGALTGGMSYEALNNIGHSQSRIIIIWNDNGRSYAPTISRLSSSLTKLRLNPAYMQARSRIERIISEIPAVGSIANSSWSGLTGALREAIEPRVFFEALGVRYAGPVNGHDVAELEYALQGAREWDGPIVVHALTQKGRGYGPAETDEVYRMHDLKIPQVIRVVDGEPLISYTEEFSKAIVDLGTRRPEVVAITAAMAGPTGLLPFSERFPTRFFDVGIAEQHAVTAAAGMAMGGLKPIVAIYSTFMSRAFDQVNLDVGLHALPVTFVIDRAGVTGDDGPSHHGVLDLVQMLSVPSLTVMAPSSTDEVGVMLETAMDLPGPSSIRFPKTPGLKRVAGEVGSGLSARRILQGVLPIDIVAVGKMVTPAYQAALELDELGLSVSLWDPRIIRPTDRSMLAELTKAEVILTVEDGFVGGGAGEFIAREIRSLRPDALIFNLGVPTCFVNQANADKILSDFGLDATGIRDYVLRCAALAAVDHS